MRSDDTSLCSQISLLILSCYRGWEYEQHTNLLGPMIFHCSCPSLRRKVLPGRRIDLGPQR